MARRAYNAAMAKAKVSQLTYADLQALPDDELHRYELIDGELLVSAAPNTAHQLAVARLHLLLHAACPPGHQVLFAPYDWLVDDHNVYEPDLLVAPRRAFTERFLPQPPLLAVEVLSPSHPGRDLVRKRAAYERAGLTHYWIVDPIAPSVTVLHLVGGTLVETGVAKADEPLAVEHPFPVTLVAADLVD